MKKILALLLLAGGAAFALTYFSTPPAHFSASAAPLADRASLEALINGKQLPKPPDEPVAWFHGARFTAPKPEDIKTDVLGTVTTSDAQKKHIEVDLSKQKVYAYEGDKKVYEFSVATGKWGATPTGTFYIWTKVRSQLMSGGDPAAGDYYYLPNVPYVMFFYNDQVARSRGYSFHGAYWHNNFGHTMSHGCINMREIDAKQLYEWATPVVTSETAWSTPATLENPGTRVEIYGEPPLE